MQLLEAYDWPHVRELENTMDLRGAGDGDLISVAVCPRK